MATSGMNPPDIDEAIVRQGAGDEPETWLDDNLPEGDDLDASPDAMNTGRLIAERPVAVRAEIDDDEGMTAAVALELTREQASDYAVLAQAVMSAAFGSALAFRARGRRWMNAALRAEMAARSEAHTPGTVGAVLDAYRKIEHLVNTSGLPLSPASIVDRVAVLVEAEAKRSTS